MKQFLAILCCAVLGLAGSLSLAASPQWGDDLGRNNVVPARDLPDHLGDDNRLWDVPLQGRSFYNMITVDGDRVYAGMSSDNLPERIRGRGAAMLCLDLKTGKTVWQKEIAEKAGEYGLSSVPLIEGDRLYVRGAGDVFCLDKNTGKVLWRNGEIQGHGAHGTGLIVGTYLWITSGHATGSDDENWYSDSIEHPWHPNVLVLDKHTGRIVAQDDVAVGGHQHGSWGSLSAGLVDGRMLAFWGDSAGWVHAFEVPETFPAAKRTTVREVWRCDANPAQYRRDPETAAPMPYSAYMGGMFGDQSIGPDEIISTPVFHDGKVYVTLGRDKAYGVKEGHRSIGRGGVVCIDPSGSGDVTDTHKLWTNTSVNRTFCTPSIVGDLLFVADHAGYVHCLDIADGGKSVWKQDIHATIWNYFQAVGDNKVFVMNEDKDFFILRADREGGRLFHAEMDSANNPQPGMTDGILIVGTRKAISAYGGPEYMKTHQPMSTRPVRKADDPQEDRPRGH